MAKFEVPLKKERKPSIKQEKHPAEKQPKIIRAKIIDKKTGKITVAPGQPRDGSKIIDWDQVRSMLKVYCNLDDCAARMGVTKQEMRNKCLQETGKVWAELEQECHSFVRESLRQMQFKKAMGYTRKQEVTEHFYNEITNRYDERKVIKEYYIPPDTQMLIHLGKHLLGQSEKLDITAIFKGYTIEDSEGNVIDAEHEVIDSDNGITDGISVYDDDDF